MQREVVVENADTAIVVNVAIADEHVPIAVHQMNAVAALANEAARDRELHRAVDLHGVGLGMRAGEFEPVDHRHALVPPDFGFK